MSVCYLCVSSLASPTYHGVRVRLQLLCRDALLVLEEQVTQEALERHKTG